MIRFNLFFYLLSFLAIACSKVNKPASSVNNQVQAQEEAHTIVLQFTEKPSIDYAKDNPMEIVLWNNPIKPTANTDLLRILPDNIKIPHEMAFVAGMEFEDTGERIKGFFIDKQPFSNKDYLQFLDQSKDLITPVNYDASKIDDVTAIAYLPNWYLANAYCQWLGKRLPTKAEWTFAFSDVARIYPSNVHLRTSGDWEWLADWYLPEGENPHIFVPDAESEKVMVKKKEQQKPFYEWKPVDRQNPPVSLTCRCVQDVVLSKN